VRRSDYFVAHILDSSNRRGDFGSIETGEREGCGMGFSFIPAANECRTKPVKQIHRYYKIRRNAASRLSWHD
jgi:hypothetical protein